jgi:sulfite reductase beta subunit-like hemoprotein
VQALARRLHRHFSGNPHFEGLPKKFKISVDAGYAGARHLIQDAGIVHVATTEAGELYDLWVAGGLGREPQPAFLFARQLGEGQLLALLEAIIHLYRQHTPAGKRLKHLLREIGEERFRKLLAAASPEVALLPSRGIGCKLKIEAEESVVEARIFAGQVASNDFRHFADLARRYGNEQLLVTADQNLLFFPTGHAAAMRLRQELAQLGFAGERRDEQVNFRICPGNHECRMGLAPTRVIARKILDGLPAAGLGLTYAISGCPNSCSQPQLADVGIVTTSRRVGEDGERQPRFALFRRSGEGFGTVSAAELSEEDLLVQLSRID